MIEDVDALYEADPEGLGIAARINQHLPATVKVRTASFSLTGSVTFA